jgi:peroxiredoxin Q/BCP
LRDAKKAYEKAGVVVLGVSPDPVSRLAKFVEKEGLNFTLLSDPEHELAEKYGVWALKKNYGREYWGILRTSFIIDKQGRLRHVIDKVKTKSHHDDVLNWVEENLDS